MSERAGSRVFVVCSDEARNGKTLVSRLLVDHLLMTGYDPYVFDCDEPRGRIRRFYPDASTLIDIEKTSGQIRLFDTILAHPDRDYVVDLPAHGLDTFFTVVEDLDFINVVSFFVVRHFFHNTFTDRHGELAPNQYILNTLGTFKDLQNIRSAKFGIIEQHHGLHRCVFL